MTVFRGSHFRGPLLHIARLGVVDSSRTERGSACGEGWCAGFSGPSVARMRFALAVGGEMPVESSHRQGLRGSSVAVAFARSSKPQGSRKTPSRGRVAEWLKAPDSKSGVLARVPGVQIPPLPPALWFVWVAFQTGLRSCFFHSRLPTALGDIEHRVTRIP